MRDDEIRRQLMDYSRQFESVAAPPAEVIRHRLRRRQVRLAAIAGSAAVMVTVGAVAAAAAVLPATRHHGPSDKTRHTQKSKLGWLPAGPELPANARPEAAPYVVSLGKGAHQGLSLTVLNWRTGKVLGHVPRPADQCFSQVEGASDDRTFLLTMINCQVGNRTASYELRLSASGRPEPLIPIGLPNFRNVNTTFALSPDGTHLAYAAARHKPHQEPNSSTVILYNLLTGTTRSWHGPGVVWTMAWAGDRTLAFDVFWNNHETKPSIAMGLRLMNIAAKGKSYAAARVLRNFTYFSRSRYPLPTANGLLYAPTEISLPPSFRMEIVRFSARTGKSEFRFRPWVLIGRDYSWCDPLWTDGSGRHVLAACGSLNSTRYLRIDGNRMRQVDLHIPLLESDQATNPHSFSF